MAGHVTLQKLSSGTGGFLRIFPDFQKKYLPGHSQTAASGKDIGKRQYS